MMETTPTEPAVLGSVAPVPEREAGQEDAADGAPPRRLEEALSRTEADASAVLRAATAVAGAAKRFRTAAQAGHLRDLRPAIGAVEQAIAGLGDAVARAKRGWDFDEDAYFAGKAFLRELLETAARMDVRLYEQDDRLYSYPSLVRILPSERAVLIDKTRERRLRPSVLVGHLRDLQKRPARFRPEAFLEALFTAYETLVAARGQALPSQPGSQGPVVRLLDLYALLTLLPGQSRDYSRHEFARDVYLLDQSGVTTTRRGYRAGFPASTGTRAPANTVRVITQSGQEKVYYGITFAPGA
jgi:hypothetical protein